MLFRSLAAVLSWIRSAFACNGGGIAGVLCLIILGPPLQAETRLHSQETKWIAHRNVKLLSPKRVLVTKTQSSNLHICVCSAVTDRNQVKSQVQGDKKRTNSHEVLCGSQATSGSRTLSTDTCCYMNEEGVRLLNEMKVVFILE